MAQTVELEISNRFDDYRKNTLQEKMFLHTDKEFYLAGEICWFKIYAVDAFFNRPLDMSKVAYVELLDMNNKPVLQAKIKLENSTGNGSLYVPAGISSGNYKIRAYSNWMKNFNAAHFFEKAVTIINTQKIPDQPLSKPPPGYDIQFFPEGGNLVNGLQSKIAFSVKDQAGKGVDCSMVIVSDKKDTVTSARVLKFGMGHFNLTPVTNRAYTALVTLANGNRISRELPVAYSKGYVMNLVADGEKLLRLTVRSIADEAISSPQMVYLFVHTRGAIKATQAASIQNGMATFLIDRSKIGDGISQFTVFNAVKQPVCERLYFKHPAQQLLLNISSDATSYSTRQKVNISINSTGKDNKPEAADMSMAVYRIDSLQLPSETNINEYLWLSSDLPGTVESPAYYFNTTGPATEEAMDNLMLTNGWRRFRWEDVLQNEKPLFKYAPEYNGHIVSGKVINNKTGSVAENIASYLSVPGTNPKFRTSISDEKGTVRFEMKGLAGTPGIIVQTYTEDGNRYHVEVDDPFADQYTQRPLQPFLMPLKNPATLSEHDISVQVENIYNGNKRRLFRQEMGDSGRFYYHPNEIYLLDNYTRFTTMEEVLREYVFSVNVRRRGGKFHLPVLNDADRFNGLFEKEPLILLDGVPIFDIAKLMSYDPLKIRKLESVTRRYFFGDMAFDGIVNLFTYNGDLAGYELDPRATVIDYEGLQLQREFYSPVYETPQELASHMPDFRNVLNWSPEIKSDKDGKYRAIFYSSDLPGKYMIEVQALSPAGIPGSNRIFFEVKKPLK